MEKFKKPSEYILVISQIYKKVVCCVHMGDEISDVFNITIGVKEKCPFFTTLLGLYNTESNTRLPKL